MTTSPPIVTPAALNWTSGAYACMPWFVDITDEGTPCEFHPLPCSYKPLVNGAEAFGAVYDAIAAARHSIDIICWGFQPSMYFKRGSDSLNTLSIGDLLIERGEHNVRIRLLCWVDTFAGAQFIENPTPGFSWLRTLNRTNENISEKDYDRAWYYRASAGRPAPMRDQFAATQSGAPSKQGAAVQGFRNIELATRDFSLKDRIEIMFRESRFRSDKDLNEEAVGSFGAAPSHHQKMVLIDYEAPEHAVGFVMGHNTLDAYWDDDAHSYARMNARFGRNGATPRQDMSARVTGPILEHLNVNFCNAWKRSTGIDLITPRAALASRLSVRPDLGTPVMAQITRTQSQENRRDIRSLYRQTANNAAKFIYIENQYFRYPPLVDNIKAAVQHQLSWGRDTGKDGSIYLFVITNSNKDGLDKGQVSTQRMMTALGRPDALPAITRLERGESLQQQQSALEAKLDGIQSNEHLVDMYGTGTREQMAKVNADYEAQKKDVQRKLDSVNNQIAGNGQYQPVPVNIPGLKVLICTLVAPDSPPGAWMDTYIHAKVMIIDDAFTTHGSANINTRSMEVDSELNICHENGAVTKALRKRLWGIHTKPSFLELQSSQGDSNAAYERATGDDMNEAYKAWSALIEKNRTRRNSKSKSPVVPVVGFVSNTTTRSALD
ncbi:phosphatidylserine/phosphatidylglycerophosphate/cardiolipin synthase family protein [Paraburkholderia sp. D15]|uniref:phospholipase D-like domain-containing protein n=1 Tax=Paraburkholderia sp. D15 TaxID=2880218 RepID=UPI002478EE6A|nr:phosphatidylserine/phosphatidylglycerophosphate/cardiolipin synthase family protein [Paraburkholderia sp. D15]WGS49124.1 phosphatidylserine/phosphatidylglycerophosphate/cardiolipin synthase family protein [Paraburkholderia sp. D15]